MDGDGENHFGSVEKHNCNNKTFITLFLKQTNLKTYSLCNIHTYLAIFHAMNIK